MSIKCENLTGFVTFCIIHEFWLKMVCELGHFRSSNGERNSPKNNSNKICQMKRVRNFCNQMKQYSNGKVSETTSGEEAIELWLSVSPIYFHSGKENLIF